MLHWATPETDPITRPNSCPSELPLGPTVYTSVQVLSSGQAPLRYAALAWMVKRYHGTSTKKAASLFDSQLYPHQNDSFFPQVDQRATFSDLSILLELVDETEEDPVPIIEDIADVTVPHVVLALDEEVVVSVQFKPETQDGAP